MSRPEAQSLIRHMLLSPYKDGRDWDPQLDPQIYFLKTGRPPYSIPPYSIPGAPYSGVYLTPHLLIACIIQMRDTILPISVHWIVPYDPYAPPPQPL